MDPRSGLQNLQFDNIFFSNAPVTNSFKAVIVQIDIILQNEVYPVHNESKVLEVLVICLKEACQRTVWHGYLNISI